MIENVLGQNSFWIVNKKLAKKVGIGPALLLSDLITKYKYFKDRGELTKDGFFFNTAKNIEENTTLSRHKQKKAIKVLEDKGFIKKELKGMPARQHFKIFTNKIVKNLQTGLGKNYKQDCEKFTTNNNKDNKNKNNKNKKTISKDIKQSFGKEKKSNKILSKNKNIDKEKKINAKDYLEKKYGKIPDRYTNIEKNADEIYLIDILENLKVKKYGKTEINILKKVAEQTVEKNYGTYTEKKQTGHRGKNWLEASKIQGTDMQKRFEKYNIKNDIYGRLRLAMKIIDKSYDIYGSPLTNIVDMYYKWQDVYTRAINEAKMDKEKIQKRNKVEMADYRNY